MALLGRSLSSSHVTSARARGAMPEAMAYNDAAVMHDSIRVEESSMEAANLSNDERKLIKRAHVRIRVENLEAADASISDMMSKYNAYAASMNAEENSRYYSLRVPSSLYDSFLAEMNGMGRMLHRSENTEDVTLRYYDLEGRLEMKRTLLRTFQSYLTRARTIEEILSVEARIAELQNDIEGTGMQLRHLSNRVDYATIDLNLVGPVAAGQTKNETFGERLKQLFGSFGSFLSTVAVIIVGIVVYGIPLMLLAALLFWVLFGRIGLLKKLWALVKGKKQE
ncbi:MAG: DUF4349 domain-containing protein [Treponema sp.]|nr:DUF4349 domain-containing protein [Treponema sp.]